MTKFKAEDVSVGVPGYRAPDRRRCVECRQVMKPVLEYQWVGKDEERPGEVLVRRFGPTSLERVVRVMYYGYGRENLFCTLRCAYRYACRRAAR